MLLTRSLYPLGSWRGAMSEMDRLRRQMDRFLGDYPSGAQAHSAGVFPALNVTEDKDKFVVQAELPGVNPEKIDISVLGKNLTIAGERTAPEMPDGVRFHRRERTFPSFSRAIGLPAEVQTDKVEAEAASGVLTIILPKSEAVKPKQIAVKASQEGR